jgi:hypothetical protein
MDEMGALCSTRAIDEKCMKNYGGKHEGKRLSSDI